MVSQESSGPFRCSEHGVSDPQAYCLAYEDFIRFCKSRFTGGTFSTYIDGEPVFLSCGQDLSLSDYNATMKLKRQKTRRSRQ